jgi:hypothetical protein
MYYACPGLPYGKEDQTLLIDDEPTKTFRNLKWSGLWPLVFELPVAKTIQVHYDHMVKYSKLCLSLSSKNYYWFVQYIDNDNGDVWNNQPSIGMVFESFDFASYFFVMIFKSWYLFSFSMFFSIDFF